MTTTSSDAQRRITHHFDEFAPVYHRSAFDGAGMATLSQRDLEVIDLACALAGDGGSACDVGVGSGRISSRLVGHGFAVCGVDASTGMLAQARARLGPGATLVNASLAERLPLTSSNFDLVTCLRVLKYLPNWPAAVQELARVAVAGGVVCFDLANQRSVARFGYPSGMVWPTTLGDARAAIVDAGLELVEVVAGAHLPDPAWRVARGPRAARVVGMTESLITSAAGVHGSRSWTFVARRR
jgi:ubiquinone/menaquinone biosynthesis C-methylase UbiE